MVTFQAQHSGLHFFTACSGIASDICQGMQSTCHGKLSSFVVVTRRSTPTAVSRHRYAQPLGIHSLFTMICNALGSRMPLCCGVRSSHL